MKKKIDIGKWLLLGGVPTALVSLIGFLVISSKTITVYAEVPKKVEKIEKYIDALEQSREVQQKANELMQQRLDKEEVIYSPDGRSYLDKESNTWKPVKRGGNG